MNSRTLALLMIGALLATACEEIRRFEDDDTFPAEIETLSCEGTAEDTVTCTWTAVGDDAMVGRAARCWIFRHHERIETGNLAQATLVDDTLQPAMAGTQESYDVTGLDPDTGYWFAVQVADDAGNSSLSKSDDGKTLDSVPPEPVPALTAEVVPTGNALTLTWTLPADTADLAGVLVVRKQDTAPSDPSDGTPVCDTDSATSHEDTHLTDGVEYHYAAFAPPTTPPRPAPLPSRPTRSRHWHWPPSTCPARPHRMHWIFPGASPRDSTMTTWE